MSNVTSRPLIISYEKTHMRMTRMEADLSNLIGRRIRLTQTIDPNLRYGDVGTIIDIKPTRSGDPRVWVNWDRGPLRVLLLPGDMFDFVD